MKQDEELLSVVAALYSLGFVPEPVPSWTWKDVLLTVLFGFGGGII